MAELDNIVAAVESREIAREVDQLHDGARLRYTLPKNTVGTWDEFVNVIADYFSYHFTQCVSRGGRLSRAEAAGRAKEAIERQYRRRGGDIVSCFRNCQHGDDGGVRTVLDTICDDMKAEGVERYVREVIDQNVDPTDWGTKVEVVRQLLRRCGADLRSSVRMDQPERYASSYAGLVRQYAHVLQQMSREFRRL